MAPNDAGEALHRSAEHPAPDAAESIDANFEGHGQVEFAEGNEGMRSQAMKSQTARACRKARTCCDTANSLSKIRSGLASVMSCPAL